MTHPVVAAKDALVAALVADGVNAMYGYPVEYDSRGSVCVGKLIARWERAALVIRGQPARDKVYWTCMIDIVSGQQHRSPKEAESQVLGYLDKVVDALGSIVTPSNIMYMVPDTLETEDMWTTENKNIKLTLQIEIGVRRL